MRYRGRYFIRIPMAIAVMVFLAGLPSSARALLGTQFTGITAGANNADTASGNPAGMTRLRETELNTVLSIGYSFSEFELKEGTTANGPGPDTDTDPFFIPSVYFVTPVTPDFRLGFALNVPFGLGSDYGDNWAGRYRVQDSSLSLLSFSPVAAYRVNSWLSLGGGLSLIYANWESESAIRNIEGPDGHARFEGDGFGVGGGVEWAFHPQGCLILNLIMTDTGDGYVNHTDSATGRIVGDYDTPYTILLDIGGGDSEAVFWKGMDDIIRQTGHMARLR